PALTATLTGTNLLCNAVCTGETDLTPTGGNVPYSYSWSNGATTQNLTSICVGTYSVTVTDASGCTTQTSITITQPTVLSATATGTNLLCNAVCIGQSSLTGSGGTTAYSYSWSNGSSTQNLSSLCIGTYTGTVTDANGCQATASVTITQPSPLSITTTGTNLLCNGVCTGQATATASGGTTAYSYKWSNGTTTQNLSSLCIGTYTATVTDANGCQVNASVTITQPTVLSATATGTNLLCNAVCIGQASITGSGGTTAYSYSWSNGSSSQNLSNLCIGTYTGTITDANGCQATASVTITQPNPLSITTTGTNLLCNAVCTGQATTTGSGGTIGYSYSWSNGSTAQNLSSLCTGTYTATITDANGCRVNASITITEPTVLSAAASGTNLLCSAVCIGQASITGSGGTIAYSYSWSNGSTSQNLSSLCIGTYTGTVTDANGCQATAIVTIIQPNPLSITTTGTNLLCNAQCTGQATATGSGGTTAYSYSWSNGSSSQNLSSLCIGTYTATITDANGCQLNASVTITEPTVLSAAATGTNLLCNAVCIGQASITGSGGTTAYTYSWNNGATTQNLSSLCIGSYTGTVTDANGCQATASVTITQPNPLSITTSGTNLLCNAQCTGQATATGSGGTTAYSYSWSNGSTTQNLSSLCAGSYTATITDANGCQVDASVVIIEPTVLSISTTGTNATCNGVCDGQASSTPSGGTVAYSYSWNNGSTTQNLSSLCVGNYTVTLRDANGCEATASVAITTPNPLSVTLTGTNLLCNAVCIGAADAAPSGGTAGYTYSWSNGSTTQNLSSLCAGNYTVTVTDANSCQVTGSIAITEPNALTASVTGTNIQCNATCDGQASLSGSGGTVAYSYNWSNGSTTQNLSSLCAGTYTGTVSDANGCQSSASVVISVPTALSVTSTKSNVLCNSVCTGSVDISPSGGSLPYTYSWATGQSSEDLSSICSGIYTVTVRDANGCEVTHNKIVTQPSALTASIVGTNLLCNAVCIGEANLTSGGGTAPHTYLWSNAATTQDLNSLCLGTYTVTVTDDVGCKKGAEITITQPNVLSITTTGTNLTCNAVCIGQASSTPSGGAGG
ncbi:SprB repeat-containing protein, partial [Sphingobacteriaceae bacterium AH-315-L07]|nr:SprB repeat-containing protein [Sphingobacteriaceae bacterium AH-315-L07]